jgi:hypothetical protein
MFFTSVLSGKVLSNSIQCSLVHVTDLLGGFIWDTSGAY